MALPFFPMYTGAWLKDTATLSLEERGAYFHLLAVMWERASEEGCFLPDDDPYIARLLGVSPSKWKRLRAVLVDNPHESFLQCDGGRVFQKRLQKEWGRAVEKSGVFAERATKAAAARWHGDEPEASQTDSKRDASSMLEASKNECLKHPSSNAKGPKTDACGMLASRDMNTCLHPDTYVSGNTDQACISHGGGGGKRDVDRKPARAAPNGTKPPPPPPDAHAESSDAAVDASPWEAWKRVADVPEHVWRVPGFTALLKSAGLGQRDHTWFDSEVAKWRIDRTAKGTRKGYRVWQDLMTWFQRRVEYEQRRGDAS